MSINMSTQVEQLQSDIRLIKEVEKHTNLYDSRCKDKDPKSREYTWMSIAKSLGVTPDVCKNRWKNLRDKYTREKKLMMLEGEVSYRCHSWPLLDEMSFLYNFVSHRNLLSRPIVNKSGVINLSKPTIQVKNFDTDNSILPKMRKPEWVEVNCEDEMNHNDDNFLDPACVLIEEEEPINHYNNEDDEDDIRAPDSKLRKLLEHKEEDLCFDDSPNENLTDSNYHSGSLSSLKVPQPARTMDEDEYFCMSIAGILRRLPKEKCSLLKIKILEILHEAQFGKIDSISTN